MDRELLERMIGAVVLLVLLVFVAPAMLDGSNDSSLSESLNSASGSSRVETIILDVAPGSDVEYKVLPGSKKEYELAKPIISAASGNYIVQLGIFSSIKNAENFAERIRKRGFIVNKTVISDGSDTFYRVYVGPKNSRSEANELAAIMAKSGYQALVALLEDGV